MKKFLGCFLVFFVLFSSGCSRTITNFTVLSTKNTEISRVDLKEQPKVWAASGSDGRFWLLFIPFGSPSIEAAVSECLLEGRGDIVMDGTIDSNWWSLLVFSYDSYSIQGNVIHSSGTGSREIKSKTE